MAELPDGVERAIIQRREEGGVLNQGIAWIPGNWMGLPLDGADSFVLNAAELAENSGGRIRRCDVVAQGTTNEQLFLGAMIFGFGPVGYGPYRVRQMIERTGPSFGDRLATIVAAGELGPGAGWSAIRSSTSRIKGLGIAFGTKVTYFASLRRDSERPTSLIADINTSWGAWYGFGIRRSVELRDSYLRYVKEAADFEAAGYRADEIENGLFVYGQEELRERRRSRQ